MPNRRLSEKVCKIVIGMGVGTSEKVGWYLTLLLIELLAMAATMN
jgi:hypothetical protein